MPSRTSNQAASQNNTHRPSSISNNKTSSLSDYTLLIPWVPGPVAIYSLLTFMVLSLLTLNCNVTHTFWSWALLSHLTNHLKDLQRENALVRWWYRQYQGVPKWWLWLGKLCLTKNSSVKLSLTASMHLAKVLIHHRQQERGVAEPHLQQLATFIIYNALYAYIIVQNYLPIQVWVVQCSLKMTLESL